MTPLCRTPRYSRSPTELNRSERASRARGVVQQLGHRDADGDDPHGVRIGFVEHGPQALDGLRSCQGTVLGIDGLQGKTTETKAGNFFSGGAARSTRESVVLQAGLWLLTPARLSVPGASQKAAPCVVEEIKIGFSTNALLNCELNLL